MVSVGQTVDVALQLRILRAERQRRAQGRQRLVGLAHPVKQLAQRHLGRRVVGQAARQLLQGGEGALCLARAFEQARQLDVQRRQVRPAGRHRREPAPCLLAVAPSARPDGKLVDDVRVPPALAREIGEHPIRLALPAGGVVKTHRHAAHVQERPAGRRDRLEARHRGLRQARVGLLLRDGQRCRPAGRIERERLPPRLESARVAPGGARVGAQARQQQRAPGGRWLVVQRLLEDAAALVVVVGGIGGRDPQRRRWARGRARGRHQLERPRESGRRRPVVSIARRHPGQNAPEVRPRRAAAGRQPARAAFQQPIERVHPGRRPARTARRHGGRRAGVVRKTKRDAGTVRDPREQPPGPVCDHRLDKDPVPAAGQADADRILIERGGPHHIVPEHPRAVDPHRERTGCAEAERGQAVAVAAHEGHHIRNRLIGRPQQSVEEEDPVAHGGVRDPPPDLVGLAGIVGGQIGRRGLALGREHRVQAGAPLPERTDDEVMSLQTERGAQRRRFPDLAALIEQMREQPRRLGRHQRLRALAHAGAHRRLQRTSVDVLVQARERRQRARPFRLRRVRGQAGGLRREQLVMRTGRVRGPRADDRDGAQQKRRRWTVQHGNPGRVPKPSRDGTRRAELAGSPRVPPVIGCAA